MGNSLIYDYLDSHTDRTAMFVAYASVAVCAFVWLAACYLAHSRRWRPHHIPEKRLNDVTIFAVVVTAIMIVCGTVAASVRATACRIRDGECAAVEGVVESFTVADRVVGRRMVRVYIFRVAGQPLQLKDQAGDRLNNGVCVRVHHMDGDVMRVVRVAANTEFPLESKTGE